MTRLAIIEPLSLMGGAIRDALDPGTEAWDQIDLLTSDPEGVGGVTDIAGEAALVQELDAELLSLADVVLCCSELDQAIVDSLPDNTRAVLVDTPESVAQATPIVAGINSQDIPGAARILSPTTSVIMLSHILSALAGCGRPQVVAHALEPASARGQAGLDELFEQTRGILSMGEKRPQEVFGTQLAFNLLPWQNSSPEDLADQLSSILPSPVDAQILTSQAGVFHCCSVGLYLNLEKDPGIEEVQALLSASQMIEISDQPETVGPVAASGTDKILLRQVVPSPSKGYWLWAVMDNLIAGANNVMAIALY